MSSQRGNVRKGPQKYKNQFAFKNNLHDTSHKTKLINSIEISNVCQRCKEKLEWRIKYKKYKIMSAPSTCTKCQQKTVKHSYHIMCQPCAKTNDCCPKCGVKGPVVATESLSKEEQQKVDQEVQQLLKNLPERKRRTFLRYAQKKDKDDTKSGDKKDLVEDLKKIALNDSDDDDFDDLDEECSNEE